MNLLPKDWSDVVGKASSNVISWLMICLLGTVGIASKWLFATIRRKRIKAGEGLAEREAEKGESPQQPQQPEPLAQREVAFLQEFKDGLVHYPEEIGRKAKLDKVALEWAIGELLRRGLIEEETAASGIGSFRLSQAGRAALLNYRSR